VTPIESGVVEREVLVAAEPETVFAFFTDPDKMIQWQGRRADLDPRSGGRFRVEVTDRHTAVGEYVELDPPHRVVFTWGWDDPATAVPPGSSTVEITLTPEGSGTLVRLAHRDLPSDESRAQHAHGWGHYLERLVTAAAGGDPGPDPWLHGPPSEEVH
jgi:uncharacterized protein YndB with AHSA1/START domain